MYWYGVIELQLYSTDLQLHWRCSLLGQSDIPKPHNTTTIEYVLVNSLSLSPLTDHQRLFLCREALRNREEEGVKKVMIVRTQDRQWTQQQQTTTKRLSVKDPPFLHLHWSVIINNQPPNTHNNYYYKKRFLLFSRYISSNPHNSGIKEWHLFFQFYFYFLVLI